MYASFQRESCCTVELPHYIHTFFWSFLVVYGTAGRFEMRCHSLFALALSLPISLADVLSSTYTVQSLTCFTGFTSTSASGSLPTTMYLNTIEELPQILHITLIPTVTITPKPFITKWTELETVTVYANATPWSGTWTTTSTQFDVSTCTLLLVITCAELGANAVSLAS